MAPWRNSSSSHGKERNQLSKEAGILVIGNNAICMKEVNWVSRERREKGIHQTEGYSWNSEKINPALFANEEGTRGENMETGISAAGKQREDGRYQKRCQRCRKNAREAAEREKSESLEKLNGHLESCNRADYYLVELYPCRLSRITGRITARSGTIPETSSLQGGRARESGWISCTEISRMNRSLTRPGETRLLHRCVEQTLFPRRNFKPVVLVLAAISCHFGKEHEV